MGKQILQISGEATTELYPATLKYVSDLDKKLDSMLSQWIFIGKGSGLELQRVDGSTIRYSERRFQGSPERVYWEEWLDEFVENDSIDILNELAITARGSGYDVERCLMEASDLLCIMVTRAYDRKADVAALLSGDGVEPGERRDVSRIIDTMQDIIRQHARIVVAENTLFNSWISKETEGASSGSMLKRMRKRIRSWLTRK